MELLNNILFWVTMVFIIMTLIVFSFQILFGFLFWLKPKKYKKATQFHKFAVIIRAHNEEDVIADSVDSAMRCDYPEDKKQVIVFAHNCTDKTAEIAKEHGARVVIIHDEDPKHKKLSYCMKLGMEQLKADSEGTYEYFLTLDADNQIDKNYIRACNDAVESGVVLGRTFENSKNLTDSVISCMNGLWYIRDNVFACRSRSALNIGCVMTGPSGLIKAEYALNWDALTASEDIEFTLKRLNKDGLKVDFINEAMVYEDMPATMTDMFNRNSRMGNGLFCLYFKEGITTLKMFFKTLFKRNVPFSLKMTYLDQYFNIALVPFSAICMTWIPLYFIYILIYTGLGNVVVLSGLNAVLDFNWFVIFVVVACCACYFIPFFFQPMFSYFIERKRMNVQRKWVVWVTILLYPCYILFDAFFIFAGFLMKPRWKKIKRSQTKIEQ